MEKSTANGIVSGTVAAIALERIKKWCLEQADDLAGPDFFATAPAWLILSSSLQIKIAHLFEPPQGQKTDEYRPVNSVDDLRKIISLSDWGRAAKYERKFVDFLIREFPAVQEEYAAAQAKSKAMKEAAQAGTVPSDDADNQALLAELGAELARDPGNREISFRRRHGFTVCYESNAAAVDSDTSASENGDGVEEAAGMSDCMVNGFFVLTTTYHICMQKQLLLHVTPEHRVGKKRAVKSPPSVGSMAHMILV